MSNVPKQVLRITVTSEIAEIYREAALYCGVPVSVISQFVLKRYARKLIQRRDRLRKPM